MKIDIDYSKIKKEKIEEKIAYLRRENIIFKYNKWIFEQFSTDILIEEMNLIRNKESRLSARKRKFIKLLDWKISQLLILMGDDN